MMENAVILATEATGERAITQPHDSNLNPAAAFLSSLTSPHSRRNMRRYLDQMANVLSAGQITDALLFTWSAVQRHHVQALRTHLNEQYAPATLNGMLSALRGVLKEAWSMGLIDAETYQRVRSVQNVKGSTLPAGRDIASGEIMALARACSDDSSAAGIRDAAIIAVLATCGLRRAELVALQLGDIDTDSGMIKVRSGKGGKSRTVYALNGALDVLKDWLAIRGDSDGALFTHVTKTGKQRAGGHIHAEKALTAQAVYKMLQKRATQAGVKDFSPHDLRRTFAGDMMDAGVDINTVSKIMGHASVTTTGRYDRRGEETKKAAAKHMHFPYHRRK